MKNIDTKNMNQKQLSNLEMILTTTNIKKVFDFNNSMISNYILKNIINGNEFSIKKLCSLIANGKVNDPNAAIKFFEIMENAQKVHNSIPLKSSEIYKYSYDYSEDEAYSCVLPYIQLFNVLNNYSDQPNVYIVADTMAMIVNCVISNIYYNLLQYQAFWSDYNQIAKIKNLIDTNYKYFQEYILIESNKNAFFYYNKRKKAYEEYHNYEKYVIDYINNLSAEYKKAESENKINNLFNSSITNNDNASLRLKYPH